MTASNKIEVLESIRQICPVLVPPDSLESPISVEDALDLTFKANKLTTELSAACHGQDLRVVAIAVAKFMLILDIEYTGTLETTLEMTRGILEELKARHPEAFPPDLSSREIN